MPEAILFDLGNTLVSYFSRAEFPAILEAGILGVRHYLQEQGWLQLTFVISILEPLIGY